VIESLQKIWTKPFLFHIYGLVLRSLKFLKLQSGSWVVYSCQWRDRKLSDFIKKIFICVPKNERKFGTAWGWL